MRLIAFDPGLHHVGWALLDPELRACGLMPLGESFDACRAILAATTFLDAHVAAVELPRVYQRGRADPDDLVRLAFVAGMLAQKYPSSRIVRPHDWKGNVPKVAPKGWAGYIIHRRTLEILSIAEQGIYLEELDRIPASLRHNVCDAVGLGLWAVKRR